MSRTVSATVQGLLDSGLTRVCHLLTFSVNGNDYFFAEDAVTHDGETYIPTLVMESPVRLREGLRTDPATVRIVNVNLAFSGVLLAEQPELAGAEATLSRLYLPALEAYVLARGRIGEVTVDGADVLITLNPGDLDPTAAAIPREKYSHLHSDGRTFPEMQDSEESHLFDGFFHLTRETTEVIEGQLPDAARNDRALADFSVWDE